MLDSADVGDTNVALQASRALVPLVTCVLGVLQSVVRSRTQLKSPLTRWSLYWSGACRLLKKFLRSCRSTGA